MNKYIKFLAIALGCFVELTAFMGGFTVGIAMITGFITGDATLTIIRH